MGLKRRLGRAFGAAAQGAAGVFDQQFQHVLLSQRQKAMQDQILNRQRQTALDDQLRNIATQVAGGDLDPNTAAQLEQTFAPEWQALTGQPRPSTNYAELQPSLDVFVRNLLAKTDTLDKIPSVRQRIESYAKQLGQAQPPADPLTPVPYGTSTEPAAPGLSEYLAQVDAMQRQMEEALRSKTRATTVPVATNYVDPNDPMGTEQKRFVSPFDSTPLQAQRTPAQEVQRELATKYNPEIVEAEISMQAELDRRKLENEIAVTGMTQAQRSSALQLWNAYRGDTAPLLTLERIYKNVIGLAQLPGNESDHLLIKNIEKMNDAMSAVMQGEYAAYAQLGGWDDRTAAIWQKITGEGIFSAQTKQMLVTLAGQLMKAADTTKQVIDRDYKDKAAIYRVNPDLVVRPSTSAGAILDAR